MNEKQDNPEPPENHEPDRGVNLSFRLDTSSLIARINKFHMDQEILRQAAEQEGIIPVLPKPAPRGPEMPAN